MYFEPAKRTYYRFPSASSINEMDLKYYFPDKPYDSGENSSSNTEIESKPDESSLMMTR